MLTAEWVRVREKHGELTVVPLSERERARALQMAEQLLSIVREGLGQQRDQILAYYEGVEANVRERRIKGGLIKLIEDRCTWGTEAMIEPAELRRELFQAATQARRQSSASEAWRRDSILARVAERLGLTPEAIEASLYADLANAQRLQAFAAISAQALVEAYTLGQAQALLLRAVHVEATVRCATANAARALFQRLKFLQLLCTVEPIGPKGLVGQARPGEGYRLKIDGPMSLFEYGTRYGQKLALVLPVLERCTAWELEALIQWTRDRAPSVFRLRGGESLPGGPQEKPRPARPPKRGAASATRESGGNEAATTVERDVNVTEPECSEVVEALIRAFERLGTDWRVRRSTAVLHLPGVGVCVPDLRFDRGNQLVYLEVLGFWSRDAVFRRVELVERGIDLPILFAVSSRLRVSEAVLEDHPSAALYVYKDTMSARSIVERIEKLVGGASPPRKAG